MQSMNVKIAMLHAFNEIKFQIEIFTQTGIMRNDIREILVLLEKSK